MQQEEPTRVSGGPDVDRGHQQDIADGGELPSVEEQRLSLPDRVGLDDSAQMQQVVPAVIGPRRPFRHTAPDPQTIWLVLDRGEASVCLQHPGFESDVIATATTAAFSEVFKGYQGWREAVDAGRIEVTGPRRLASALPTWFRWSPWATLTRERADRARETENERA